MNITLGGASNKHDVISCLFWNKCMPIYSSNVLAFEHEEPRQCPQAIEHFIPCFLQVHLAVAQSVVQLHRIIFKSSAGAGGISISIGCNPVSLRTHPHSSGSKSHWGSFHWFVCRKTRLLWNLAEAEVGGKTLGSTCVKLVATLSKYILYRRPSKVSDFFPLYNKRSFTAWLI